MLRENARDSSSPSFVDLVASTSWLFLSTGGILEVDSATYGEPTGIISGSDDTETEEEGLDSFPYQ